MTNKNQLTKIYFKPELKNGVTKIINAWYDVPKMECPQYVTPGVWDCTIKLWWTDNPYIVIAGVKTNLTKAQAEELDKYKKLTWGAKMLNNKLKFEYKCSNMKD